MTISSKQFKDWVIKVKILKIKKKELEDEYKFLDVQTVDVRTACFDNEGGSSGKGKPDSVIMNHLIKLDNIKNKITAIECEILRYNEFKKKFNGKEYEVILQHYEKDKNISLLAEELCVSKRHVYQLCRKIESEYKKTL